MYEFISARIEELKERCRHKFENGINFDQEIKHIVNLSEIRLKYIHEQCIN